MEGLGEERALVAAGGIERLQEAGRVRGGSDGEFERLDLLGVAARFEAVEVPSGRARAGALAAALGGWTLDTGCWTARSWIIGHGTSPLAAIVIRTAYAGGSVSA